MSWSTRLSAAVFAAAVALPGLAGTASAAVPGNDTPSGATAISSLPTTISENTVGATTDSLDSSLGCSTPATNGSVWFSYTPTVDTPVMVDGRASDFSAGFMVTVGNPSDGYLVTCGPQVAGFMAYAGNTYYVMAFSDQTDVAGGNLNVTFKPVPSAPATKITINPVGTVNKDGSALISGTYTCTTPGVESLTLYGRVIQKLGKTDVLGYFKTEPTVCDTTARPWTALATTESGAPYVAGKTATAVIDVPCTYFECTRGRVERSVALTKAPVKG